MQPDINRVSDACRIKAKGFKLKQLITSAAPSLIMIHVIRLPLWGLLIIVMSTTARVAQTAVPFETFDGSFDLLGQLLTFTPDGKDSYSHCAENLDR